MWQLFARIFHGPDLSSMSFLSRGSQHYWNLLHYIAFTENEFKDRKSILTRVAVKKKRKNFKSSLLYIILPLDLTQYSCTTLTRVRIDRQDWGWRTTELMVRDDGLMLALAFRHGTTLLSDLPVLCLCVHIFTCEAIMA